MTDLILKWHGPPVPDLEPQIVAEIRDLLKDGLPSVSRLIFHHVLIGNSFKDGPVIKVWGEDGDSVLHCEFHKTMSDDFSFDLDEFKDAPWYETVKKHWEDQDQ